MVAAQGLSEQDVEAVRAGLSDGRAVTVWFTPAAVGVPAGGSAKIVSVEEVAEGDFIQIRPTGSRDTMFCSAGELTRTRPPRRTGETGAPKGRRGAPAVQTADAPAGAAVPPAELRPAPERPSRPRTAAAARPASTVTAPHATASEPTASRPTASEPTAARPTASEPTASRPTASEPTASRPAASRPAASQPAASQPPVSQPPVSEPAVEKAPARGGRAAARPPAEVTVVLAATGDGDWTVEVTVGRKRTVRPTPVQPGDVAVAARALPPAVAEAISSSLDAARRRRAEQVERLRAELEAAERALRELTG